MGKKYSQQQNQGGSHSRSKNRSQSQKLQAEPCTQPYHFVPVHPELAIHDAPVFHDVQQTSGDFFSGELHCTLTCLTPTLAANFQFEYRHVKENLKQEFGKYLANNGLAGKQPENEKKVIEPLFTRSDANGMPERVLIPGEAIKGAVRQSLAALLSAPMERVQERQYSFRPNLNDAINIRPALVHGVKRDQHGKLLELEVEIVSKNCDDVVYVQHNSEQTLRTFLAKKDNGYPDAAEDLDNIPLELRPAKIWSDVPGLRIDYEKQYAKKLASGNSADLKTYVLARYRGGEDGKNSFAIEHNRKNQKRVDPNCGYRWALVPRPYGKESSLTTLRGDIVNQFAASLSIIGDDKIGHLAGHPLHDLNQRQVKKNVDWMKQNAPQQGDLLFVEFRGNTPIGIGWHFRHRRVYRDSIHQQGPLNQSAEKRLRQLLCPTELESRLSDEGAPQKLSSARILFGYVGQTAYDPQQPNQPLTFGIGKDKSDFQQLAGRISINWAVEQPRDSGSRFLNEKYGCFVPLRPLGEPKASAVETYLTQENLKTRTDGGTLCTYGDDPQDPAAGQLNGRKSYLHQPGAASAQAAKFQLVRGGQDWTYDAGNRERHHILEKQSVLARFVSTPQSTFKFSLRFRDLRKWELGALLFVLTANQEMLNDLLAQLQTNPTPNLEKWRERATGWLQQNPNQPLLALKLGHGRPLGLGSISIAVDEILQLNFASENAMEPNLAPADLQQQAIKALAEKLKQEDYRDKIPAWLEKVLLPWLQVHRFAGRKNYDYKRLPDKHGKITIYNYHTTLRRDHAKGRKLPKPTTSTAGGLVSLNALDGLEAK